MKRPIGAKQDAMLTHAVGNKRGLLRSGFKRHSITHQLNARLALTPDELREFQAGLELLIEPYATRRAADAPNGAALVRILAYFMPEAPAP